MQRRKHAAQDAPGSPRKGAPCFQVWYIGKNRVKRFLIGFCKPLPETLLYRGFREVGRKSQKTVINGYLTLVKQPINNFEKNRKKRQKSETYFAYFGGFA
jgi:hypothetical protein